MDKIVLEKLIKESECYSDVLKKLNMGLGTSNYQRLKTKISEYSLDVSHFDANKVRKRKSIDFRRRDINEYLIENSKCNRTLLKERLYSEGLKKRECELCGQTENWKGKKISLIIDHINGIWNDNRVSNLRIVCPNCNATLDTHCGKHKSKKNKRKLSLGISINERVDFRKIFTNEKLTSYINKRKVDRPEYQKLINEVENLGFSATGRKYGVSDNAIRKWIKTYEKLKI